VRPAGVPASSSVAPASRTIWSDSAIAHRVIPAVMAVTRCCTQTTPLTLQVYCTKLDTKLRCTSQAAMLPSTANQTFRPPSGTMRAWSLMASLDVGGEDEGREHQDPHGVDEVPVQGVHLDGGVALGRE